jgi:hypothetical protein
MSARIRVRIDGETIYNGTIKDWSTKPPDAFRDQIKPNANPSPWFKAILVTMADAVLRQQSMNIDVDTGNDLNWEMRVSAK